MPTDLIGFHKSRKEWSRWKHEILKEYLKIMPAILRSRALIYYVDGFAGQGRYPEDNTDGSALLAAKHAKNLSYSGRDYTLHCINVEYDEKTFLNLQDSTRKYEEWVENFHGGFANYVPTILERIGDQPALFFLDPIGLKGLEWSALLPVFQRSSTTELLVRYDAQTATRLTGNDVGLHKTFNDILGEVASDYWLRYVNDFIIRPFDKKSRLTKAYEDKLREHFEFVARIPIRSSDNQLKYYLLFATRSLTGIRAMNDAVNKVRDLRASTLEEEQRLRTGAKQSSIFTEQDLRGMELPVLKRTIEKEMSDGEPVLRADLRARVAIVDDNLGRYSVSQFTGVLGGRARGISVPKDFESLKARIQIHNGLTLGNDKVEISLKS